MLSRIDYFKAVDEVVKYCRNSTHRENLITIYLAGSMARGDFSPGRSDIDMYLVLKDRNQEFEEELANKAKEITSRYLVSLLEVVPRPITCQVTTLDEICQGRSFLGKGFEYHNFATTAKLLYGTDIRAMIPKPTRAQEKEMAKNALLGTYEIVQGSEVQEPNEDHAGAIFSTIFRTAAIVLCGSGRYVSGKQETVQAFKEFYEQEKDMCNVIAESYCLWQEWEKYPLTRGEFVALCDLCEKLVVRLCKVWGVGRLDQDPKSNKETSKT